MRRYLCIDFETNGFAKRAAPPNEWPLPFANYPIQVSVDIVEDGVVHHAYDSLIRGAKQLAPWVRENVPISIEDLQQNGKDLREVLADIAALLSPGDTIVAHNVTFDLSMVVGRATERLGIDTPEVHRILSAPRFCTMRCNYSRSSFKGPPKLQRLCDHFQVTLERAHDATGDSAALAACVAEALHRGVMFTPCGPLASSSFFAAQQPGAKGVAAC